MPRNPTTGVYTPVDNSFSDPVSGTLIEPVDATQFFDDLTAGLNSLPTGISPTWTGLHTFDAGIDVASNQNITMEAGTGVLDFSNGTTISRRISDGSLVLTSQSGQIQSEDLINLVSSGGVNGTSSTPLLLGVTNGNTGSGAITSHATPTVLVSRIEKITDTGSSTGEDGPAIMGSNTTFGGATQQAVGIAGSSFAQSTAAADVVGVYGTATQTGSGGTRTAYGGFFLGTATTSGSGSIGVQLQNSNNTNHSKPYVPSTFFSDGPFIVSLDVAYASTTASNGQANILLRSGGGTVDVGLAILNGTSSADIRTDTTATNILLAGPTAHTNGVNLAAGTFSGNAFSSPGFAVNGSGAITGSWSGSTIPVATGGTGITSYAVGDLIYASASTTLAKLADVATGSALISGGITTAPSWGKIGISTHVSGLGTGVATALGTNIGSAGAFVAFNGALGTPSSGTATNLTGLPISTGLTGTGTGVLTALAVNVGSAGAPVVFNGALGTPSSGTVTNLTGTASININGTVGATTPGTGAFTSVAYSTTLTGTSTNANAIAVGRQGATNPVLQVDASTATVATGLKIKGAAAAGGLALSVITSGTNENLTIDAAGAGTINIGGTSTGAITLTRATTMSAAITYGGVTLSNAVTGTGKMVLDTSPTIASPTFTGTIAASGPFGAWTSYTPSVTAGSGTITTSSASGSYMQLGKTVFYTAKVTITTNGTGASTLRVTLPVASKNEYAANGKNAQNGKAVAGIVAATDTVIVLTDYLGSYPAGDGSVIDISGVYEIS